LNPKAEFFRSILSRTGGDGLAAHQVREVRTETSVRNRAADRMTVDASSGLKNTSSLTYLAVLNRWLLLRADPGSKIFAVIHRYTQKHLGVLSPAILGALTQKDACAVRIHPHTVGMIWNQVGFARELWNPETVIGVSRKQLQECRSRIRRITDRNVQLIGGDDPKLWISELPPVLVSDGCDFNGGGGEWGGPDCPEAFGGCPNQ